MFQGDPHRAAQTELRRMRAHCAGTGSLPSHRSRSSRTGIAGVCTGGEIFGSSAAVSAIGDLCAPGIELERSTLADWVGGASRVLAPLVEAPTELRMSSTKLHADETPVPVLAPGEGQTKVGRLWTYVRDNRPAGDVAAPAVWFAYSPDRKGEHPAQHLKTFRGTLQPDAYAGFRRLYEEGGIREAGCWAHCRRHFYDLHQAHKSPIAAEALARIGHLYAIENEIREHPPAQRQQERNTRARPLLDALKQWLESNLTKLSQKSELAKAIRYPLARWPALVRYCDDGQLEIDNNAAERALRAIALGRKNYLFARSDTGGERTAAIYSLIGSTRALVELLPWSLTLLRHLNNGASRNHKFSPLSTRFSPYAYELSAKLFEQVRSSEGLGIPARERPQAADISTA